LAEESQPALAVWMGGNQPEIEPCEPAQQTGPDNVPPDSPQEEEDEEWKTKADRPPAGSGDPVASGQMLDSPG
jgi:hypothetical protein